MTNFFKRIAAGIKNTVRPAPDQAVAAQPEARKSLVNSTHVGQWGKYKFTVINIATGQAEVTLAITEQISEWVSGAITRQEHKWSLAISRPQSPDPIPVGVFDAANQAEAEFDRVAAGLAVEFFGRTISPAAVISAVKQPRGRFKRFAFALGPWVGGGLAVILFSLIVTAGGSPSAKVASIDLGGSAPAAWNGLSPEQKEVLLKITEQAAENYAGRKPEGLRAALIDGVQAAPGVQAPQFQLPAPVKAAEKLSPDQLVKVKASYSLKIGGGKKVFYAFEDPSCSACQHFARQSRNLGGAYGLTILPIGFQKGGRETAAVALCSANPLQAWSTAMAGGFIEGKPCEAGYKKVDENNALFLALGLKATPTIVGANGALSVGSSDTAEIAQWVDANGK